MKHQLCRNCGHIVEENYCPSCGQRTMTHRLEWKSLAESVTSTFIGDEAYGLRGINMRKGLVMTWLSILIQPYVSISEFLHGHRRKYFNPVAIVLMLSTFYSVVFLLADKEFSPKAAQGQSFFVWLAYSYIDYATLHPAANMLLSLPFFALGMKTVFGKISDLKYVEYLYIGIFLSIFEMTLMVLTLPAELLVPWYSSFYMQTLPVFIYSAYVCWRLFGLKKKKAVLRTFTAYLLEYVYLLFATFATACLALGSYYLIAPEKLKAEFSSSKNVRTELGADSVENKGILTDMLNGVIDALGSEETPEAAAPAEPARGGDEHEKAGTQKNSESEAR